MLLALARRRARQNSLAQPIDLEASAFFPLQQSGGVQNSEVMRHRGDLGGERLGQLTDVLRSGAAYR